MAANITVLLVGYNEEETSLVRDAVTGPPDSWKLNCVQEAEDALLYLNKATELESENIPKLILLNLDATCQQGIDFLRTVKSSDTHKTIPVIVLSRKECPESKREAYTSNANCFIAIPEDKNQYKNLLSTILHYWGEVSILPPNN